jgi:DNA-directed RNA polymerase specialized sigma24 family protein
MDVTRSGVPVHTSDESGFTAFFDATEPGLRRAFMAAYGFDTGREATAEALAWAWEHREELDTIEHPVTYLYRVGQSRIRRGYLHDRRAGSARRSRASRSPGADHGHAHAGEVTRGYRSFGFISQGRIITIESSG